MYPIMSGTEGVSVPDYCPDDLLPRKNVTPPSFWRIQPVFVQKGLDSYFCGAAAWRSQDQSATGLTVPLRIVT